MFQLEVEVIKGDASTSPYHVLVFLCTKYFLGKRVLVEYSSPWISLNLCACLLVCFKESLFREDVTSTVGVHVHLVALGGLPCQRQSLCKSYFE